MWRDDAQRSAAIRILLEGAHLGRWWTDVGPSVELAALVVGGWEGVGAYSHGEQVMLRVAMDYWNGQGHAALAEVLDVLDGANLGRVASLALALAAGASTVDRWLEAHD